MVAPALDAADSLASEGISARILDMHTVKPIDREALQSAASETGAVASPRNISLTAGSAASWP